MPDLLESLKKTDAADIISSLKTGLTRANLQTRAGIPYASGAPNEALAFRIADLIGLSHIISFAGVATITAPDFILPSEMLESKIAEQILNLKPKEKTFLCSIQPFIDHSQNLSELEKDISTSKIIPQELRRVVFEQQISHKNIEDIILFEMLVGECDPNKGNYLGHFLNVKIKKKTYDKN